MRASGHGVGLERSAEAGSFNQRAEKGQYERCDCEYQEHTIASIGPGSLLDRRAVLKA